MRLTYNECMSRFDFHCSHNDRQKARQSGCYWDAVNRVWFAPHTGVAVGLRAHADEKTKNLLDNLLIKQAPWPHAIVEPNGKKLYPFQREAVQFALSRSRSYLALDPGLGKTPTAVSVVNTLNRFQTSDADRVLYITPPFLKLNIQAEFELGLDHKRALFFVNDGKDIELATEALTHCESCIVIFPDSLLHKLPQPLTPSLTFIDEAHRFKEMKALRTIALFERALAKSPRQVFLSGTPMPNCPIELFPVLHYAAPEAINFMDFWGYAKYYCAAYRGEWGWVFNGAKNQRELGDRVRKVFMLRMKKVDVLTSLPPKIEDVVLLPADCGPSSLRKELKRLEYGAHRSRQVAELLDAAPVSEVENDDDNQEEEKLTIATMRRLQGLVKVEPAVEFVKTILDENPAESVLLFAWHKEVIQELNRALVEFMPLIITGDVKAPDRNEMVRLFQSEPRYRLLIGNIAACGVGFTLTKASRVVFAEYDWVPANNDQASDRAHRIGQVNSVLVQYLVRNDSLDLKVLQSLLRKKKTIGEIIDASPEAQTKENKSC